MRNVLPMILTLAVASAWAASLEAQDATPPASADQEKPMDWWGEWDPRLSFGAGGSVVGGDRERFSEYYQVPSGVVGGFRSASAHFVDRVDGIDLLVSARAAYEADYGVGLKLTKYGLGYVSVDFDQHPRYYDTSDIAYGWPPAEDSATSSARLDKSAFKFEIGLRDADLPEITLGFDRIERDGSTNLFWGGHTIPNLTALPDPDAAGFLLQADLLHAYVIPLVRDIGTTEERLHGRLTHRIDPVDFGVRFEWRNKDGSEAYDEPWYVTPTPNVLVATQSYRYRPDFSSWMTGANVGVDVDENLRLSADYEFLHTENDSKLTVDARTPAGARYFPTNHSLVILPGTRTDNDGDRSRVGAKLDWEAHPDLNVWVEGGYGSATTNNDALRNEDGTEGAAGGGNDSLADEIWIFDTKSRETFWTEEVGVSLTAIPITTVTLSADFEQSDVSYDWNADFSDGPDAGVVPDQGNWLWKADADYDRLRATARFSIRPDPDASIEPFYQYRDVDFDLDEKLRNFETKPGDPEYTVANTARHYPGQIKDTSRRIHSAGVGGRFRPAEWVTIRPRYELQLISERNADEAFEELGETKAHSYGVGLDFYPDDGWTVAVDGSRRTSVTKTPATKHTTSFLRNPLTGAAARGWRGGLIDPFESGYWTATTAVRYSTDGYAATLHGGVNRSEAWWDTQVTWVGVAFEHEIAEHARFSFGYTFSSYDESGNDSFNDFEAHFVAVGVTFGR